MLLTVLDNHSFSVENNTVRHTLWNPCVLQMWAVIDFACLELSFPLNHFVPLSLPGFFNDRKEALKKQCERAININKI